MCVNIFVTPVNNIFTRGRWTNVKDDKWIQHEKMIWKHDEYDMKVEHRMLGQDELWKMEYDAQVASQAHGAHGGIW